MSHHPDVRGFFGPYRFLSNFHLAEVVFEGDIYISSEHAYQSAKEPDRERRKVYQMPGCSCRDARQLGNVPPLKRSNWHEIKFEIMTQILCYKFSPDHHPDLVEKLLATGDALLVETNSWHDNSFGDCECGKRESCKVPGQNQLGKILMQIRSALQQDSK